MQSLKINIQHIPPSLFNIPIRCIWTRG